MRKASVRELRIHTSKLLREASAGEVITIESRGVPIAELHPISTKKQPPLPDMSDIWNTFPQISGDSTDIISEDRDR
jgi:prevent-host-death family protein